MIVGNFWRQCCFAVLVQFFGAWWLQVLGSSEKKIIVNHSPQQQKGTQEDRNMKLIQQKAFGLRGVVCLWPEKMSDVYLCGQLSEGTAHPAPPLDSM